jgi:hypothetical protein
MDIDCLFFTIITMDKMQDMYIRQDIMFFNMVKKIIHSHPHWGILWKPEK